MFFHHKTPDPLSAARTSNLRGGGTDGSNPYGGNRKTLVCVKSLSSKSFKEIQQMMGEIILMIVEIPGGANRRSLLVNPRLRIRGSVMSYPHVFLFSIRGLELVHRFTSKSHGKI